MAPEELHKCDNASPDPAEHCLTREERGKILQRIHSALYYVGEFIPEEYELDGEKINLRNTIFAYITKDRPSPEEVRKAMALADRLDEDAKNLEKVLKTKEITVHDAQRLLAEVCGLLRGVEEIRHVSKEQTEVLKKLLMAKVEDERRWLGFVKEIK